MPQWICEECQVTERALEAPQCWVCNGPTKLRLTVIAARLPVNRADIV